MCACYRDPDAHTTLLGCNHSFIPSAGLPNWVLLCRVRNELHHSHHDFCWSYFGCLSLLVWVLSGGIKKCALLPQDLQNPSPNLAPDQAQNQRVHGILQQTMPQWLAAMACSHLSLKICCLFQSLIWPNFRILCLFWRWDIFDRCGVGIQHKPWNHPWR